VSNTNFPEPNADLIAELQSALNEPDPDGDRDYPGPEICPQCDHRLRIDSEGRCCSCGYC